jgi:Nucleoside-diphosphate-sugar epimerases
MKSERKPQHVLLTGAAGFIGSHVAGRLLERGDRVMGLDNLSDYYDPALKQARLQRLEGWRIFVLCSSTWPTAREWQSCSLPSV